MPPVAESHDATYWRSLDQLAETPKFRRFVESEFPSRAGELVDPLSRRRFMQVMGASLALAGLNGCDDNLIRLRWPKEEILPFATRPPGRHPGTPVDYATAMELGGVGVGLLVKSVDGRPIKVEGNDQHPDSRGATDSFAQASLLDLYDPDRSRGVYKDAKNLEPSALGKPNSSWGDFAAALKDALDKHQVTQGEDLLVLSEASSSRTVAALRKRLEGKFPKMKWVEWEPFGRDTEWEGTELAFGQGQRLRTHLHLAQAHTIVSFDSDLLHSHPNALRLARDFMDARRATDTAPESQTMCRLYVAESSFSITGTMADHRAAVPSCQIPQKVVKLARLLMTQDLSALLGQDEITKNIAAARASDPFLADAAADLFAAKGRGVIAVGSRQPAAVHALGHLLNHALGNAGQTVTYTDAVGDRPSFIRAMQEFTGKLNNSQVGTILIIGGNPVVDVPPELKFAEGLGKAQRSIYLGSHLNETALRCNWHLPRAHYLESWGDTRGWDGTVSVVQPLIAPIWEGRSAIELLSLFLGQPKSGYELVRETLKAELNPADFERAWRRWLHEGVIKEPSTRLTPRTPALRAEAVREHVAALESTNPPKLDETGLELVLTQDGTLYDGRYANNGWLQELPHPVSKLTWDNALWVSPATATALKLETGSMATVTVSDGQALEVAVIVLPGLPEWSVSLSLGHPGKHPDRAKAAGVVGRNTGFDAYPLRKAGSMYVQTGVRVTKSSGEYVLAMTQDHWTVMTAEGQEETQRRISGEKKGGRSSWWLVREVNLADYKDPERRAALSGYHGPDPATNQLWKPPVEWGKETQPFRWGMAIDLNACTGCSSCVVACQAENNIPVVGKSEVERGREMHWLRIDRYFRGDPRLRGPEAAGETLSVIHQPVPCMQCENAPCESVCPVAATTHSTDGLNDMAYNRCIGTRYCSNNCPYKVRRFNWFWNHHGPFHPRSEPGHSRLPKPPEVTPLLTDVEKMGMNPEVTVRSRGVMEKCTYCVQRIKAVTIPLLNQTEKRTEGKRVKVPDGAIKTACQQACPTQAIVFGDLEDPNSRVSQLVAHQRAYAMLAELNTRPRTRYMAKLRNPRVEAHTK